MELQLYNTASRSVERFVPLRPPEVSIYSCGMTVYSYAHIGHLRAYTSSDVLRRALEYAGWRVRHVMNVTDVGHMTSDADEGEDKLEAGARREGKSPWEIARHYEQHFFDSIRAVNVKPPHVISRATEHIAEQIQLIRRLEQRGFTYLTSGGVVFDTAKFPRYADFARLDLQGNIEGHRTRADAERRNPADFALWVINKPDHVMQWDSPWGRGYPGWHIECSAMAMHYLGEQLDVHTGGIDHIPVHHTNEIAQSECGTGRAPFARYWFHTAFLNVAGAKMSKSLGNLYTLDDLRRRGFSPLALRFQFMASSYRKPLNFTWEALESAQRALLKIWETCAQLPAPGGEYAAEQLGKFEAALADDLNTSAALAALHELLAADAPGERKAATLYRMDEVLGLELANARTRLNDVFRLRGATADVERQALELAQQRQELRAARDFRGADALREKISTLGFQVMDTPEGPKLKPNA